MISRIKLFGFEFISEADISVIANDILSATSYEKDGYYPFLITPNVDDVVKFSRAENKELRDYFTKSIYMLPDGQPIVWSSGLLGKKIIRRIPGSDLLPFLLDTSKVKHQVLALTSSDTISNALHENTPGVISYTLPFFNREENDKIQKITDDCVKILTGNDIKLVIIGVSFPKQNILAINIYNKLKAINAKRIPLFCMLGGSFEFYFNLKKRAPVIFQKLGLEWFHRFSTEPKRLFKRYFVDDMAFLPILIKEVKKNKTK